MCLYPPPRLPRRASHAGNGPHLSSPRFPGRHSLGVPPWEGLPGRASLGKLPWERCPRRSLPGKDLLGPGHPAPRISWNHSHDFLSPSFLACFSTRSGAALFRSWHRKTSQNGAQTLPKWSPKRVRNRSYVENAEK